MTRFEIEAREADRRRSGGQPTLPLTFFYSFLGLLILGFGFAKGQDFRVENKTTPVFQVRNKVADCPCGPACPCPAGVCSAGKCPVVVGGVCLSGEGVRVCGPDGCRIVRQPAPGAQVAPAYPGGNYYLGDGEGWWLGKALGRSRPAWR